ncbi:HemK methyltransferase member 2 [Coemansia sp. RSA 1813]|nr:HemK methyltransferase member 2 [Coemansia sp. RSA 1646]KAJ1772231.1 HemK methyltransferase member 2 [Coemansia sp. RSA 1843]KAJ2091863.1 HemK methyltransferase member 2 [Coemansia sp. RSA 986]KAJ2215810.1 HemK methyltransferase member 2 [Coemansia sp. RSA 487]KAJ2571741.1 HemK methyltransferase member 2 [Coemansia sp. RSA 1813]
MGLPTPNTGHLSQWKYDTVYEPAEDTYLLLDALEHDQLQLHEQKPAICAEIGSGSGCVSAFLAQVLDPHRALVLSTDINPAATMATQETISSNKHGNCVSDQVRTRFVQAMDARLRGNIDVLLFNPPYVVTPTKEIDATSEASAWAGGIHGREVLDLLLPNVASMLAPRGRFYLVVIEQNKPEEIIALLQEDGLTGERVLSRKAGREHLSILRFIKA